MGTNEAPCYFDGTMRWLMGTRADYGSVLPYAIFL